ncbi:MAG: hypothetical protein AMJ88_08940 [Anaerolineae bacterium SM23_ 63]|nr:MAG: hypothetical protein AMJ88_08940 [Anaerolineae bacterium SM23_ 63]
MKDLKPLLLRLSSKVLAFGLDLKDPRRNAVIRIFKKHCRGMDRPRVLESRTKRSVPDRSTWHDEWIHHAGEYHGCDIESGVDVRDLRFSTHSRPPWLNI